VNNSVKPLRVAKKCGSAGSWFQPWAQFVFRHASKQSLLNISHSFDQSLATEI
jgi:hypothetical protein